MTDIVEVRIGYDGIVFASDIERSTGLAAFDAERSVRSALGAESAGRRRQWSTNPYTDSGPRSTLTSPAAADHGVHPGHQARHARSVRRKGSVAVGCEDSPARLTPWSLWGMSEDDAEGACLWPCAATVMSVDIDGDYTETLARIDAEPERHRRVSAWRFYENNTGTSAGRDDVRCYTCQPAHSIAAGDYPVSRPLLLLSSRQAHVGVIPGVQGIRTASSSLMNSLARTAHLAAVRAGV